MGSGSPTLKMVTHTRTLLLLLLGVTVLDVKGQSVVFPSNSEDAIVIENPRKAALSSLPMRWKRLNRLKNIWSERDNNKTNIMSRPMDNEVEWGTEIFETRTKDGNLCGDGSTYCTRHCKGAEKEQEEGTDQCSLRRARGRAASKI